MISRQGILFKEPHVREFCLISRSPSHQLVTLRVLTIYTRYEAKSREKCIESLRETKSENDVFSSYQGKTEQYCGCLTISNKRYCIAIV